MMNQVVYDTSQLLALKGVKRVVLSPGSRNAPLTVSFARNPEIRVYNIVDERSAGFIALGMAQRLNEPVALCCTSGTALLNYGPAIAEAYYQQLPLIVISADRPQEWIGQRDGQTINQIGAIGNFVKATFQLPANPVAQEAVWEYQRKLNEAINLAGAAPQGPVHVNIPFREPFYPGADQVLTFSEDLRLITPAVPAGHDQFDELVKEWSRYDRRMIIIGQQMPDPQLDEVLSRLSGEAVVIADVLSNTPLPFAIRHQDLFLAGPENALAQSLQPDLIITLGKSVISKNLKLFLRKNPPKIHWHFDESMVHADPFQTMTHLVKGRAETYLQQVAASHPEPATDFNDQVSKNFIQTWQIEDTKTRLKLHEALNSAAFGEFHAFRRVIESLPAEADVHLANSMPVRYANFIQSFKSGVTIFANRGTSGIDGTNGTAVGNALVSDRPTYLLTGDLSFFYDRNAFFHHYPLHQLKIIVFNNGGGGIFRLIQGPADLPELQQHFETRHAHTARFTAMEYQFDYYQAKDPATLEKELQKVINTTQEPQLLEIFTNPEVNSRVYQEVKQAIKRS